MFPCSSRPPTSITTSGLPCPTIEDAMAAAVKKDFPLPDEPKMFMFQLVFRRFAMSRRYGSPERWDRTKSGRPAPGAEL